MATHLNQSRTAVELIADLESESPNFDAVGIAVGFEEHATFIFANDESRLEKLNAALSQGGKAIGLLGVRKMGEMFTVGTRVFREYSGEQWAREFLDELSDSCGQKLKSGLGKKAI